MPKINWQGSDDVVTAEDIDEAEEGFQQYTGDMPPGGVYRFKIRRAKYTEFNSGNQGLNVLLVLDGSWKAAHRRYDGCTLWDRIVMTKAAAGFVKAFAAGIGVSAADLVSKVIVDEDNVVTKIGKKSLEDLVVYVAVKKGSYNDEPRLEKAGTGYQVIEDADAETEADEEEAAAPPRKAAKAAPAKATAGKAAGKAGKNKGKSDDDEPPF